MGHAKQCLDQVYIILYIHTHMCRFSVQSIWGLRGQTLDGIYHSPVCIAINGVHICKLGKAISPRP